MRAPRPLLVLGLLLVGPAVVLASLGWRSLERDDRRLRARAWEEARKAADDDVAAAAEHLEEVRRREEQRPYFQYQARYMPEGVVTANSPAFVESPLEAPPEPGGPAVWFEWTLSRGVISGPEVFPSKGTESLRARLPEAYGEHLRTKLLAAPGSPDLERAPAVATPLRVVAANEEVGQLLEEVAVAQSAQRSTAYLDNFVQRVEKPQRGAAGEPQIAVRATGFRYLALPSDHDGLPLLAWRLVWIPGAPAKDRRDAPVDRWLLQGYAFTDPVGLQPGRTVGPGGPVVARGAAWPDFTIGQVTEADAVRRSLLDVLPVETVRGGERAHVPLGLTVVALPNLAAVAAAVDREKTRFLVASLALLCVVGVGFAVLVRGARREVALARRKQDFVAAVTHELKTPLAGIRMYADMLKEGWVPEGGSAEEYAERIVGETKRLAALVDQVLDLSAFDRGVATCRPVPGDLAEAVRAAVALAEPAAAEAGVPLRVDAEEGLPLVAFDPDLLRPIVLNLVDNAVKYSARSATKDVRVAVRREGRWVALAVADRGPGIPREDQARLFEPFSRGGREETRTARGVGLGLALVRRYADAQGARVALSSEVGLGTTVTVRFPE